MRYLKRFFESKTTREELLDFCETNLAYLVDEGYEIYVKNNYGLSLLFSLTIPSDISTEEDYDTGEFEWNKVKDHFIPFLTHLNNKYNIVPFQSSFTVEPNDIIQFFTNAQSTFQTFKYYTVQEVLDDKPSELNCYLYEISIKVRL